MEKKMLTKDQEEFIQQFELLEGGCEEVDLTKVFKSGHMIDGDSCAYKTKPNLMNVHSNVKAEGFMDMKSPLTLQIEEILSKASAESESNTPDFVLAEYLMDCLAAFNKATNRRNQWYGGDAPQH